MRECKVCRTELGLLEKKYRCLDGFICESCYLQTQLPEEKIKTMTIDEIKREIFHKDSDFKMDYSNSKNVDSSSAWTCPTCSQENKGADEICSKCLTPKPIKESANKNLDYVFRNNTAKIILIGLLIFIAIVFITVFVASPSEKENNKANANVTTTTKSINTTTTITPHTTTTTPKATTTTTTDVSNVIENGSSDEGYDYYLDKNDNKVYYTTKPTPKMPFKKGENIDVWGNTEWKSDTTFWVDADNGWLVDCSNVDYFDKLKDLVLFKNVTFNGDVIGEYKIKFSSVKVENKTYTLSEFTEPVPNTLYEDDNVKISFAGIRTGYLYSSYDSVCFTVTNKCDFQITIQCDSISLDGIQIDGNPTMSDDVAPKSTAKVYARYHESIENENPSRISGNLKIIDFNYSNSHFDTYDATFVNVKTYK